MKIAITSTGDTLESKVDPRFGRAAKFIVYDTETGSYQANDNIQNLNAPQGAGIQSAQTVCGFGVGAVLTGHCGPKAFQTLSAGNVKIYTDVQGTVNDAIEAFKSGNLSAANSADVEGHWA
jgi:predicted Fe-Mo cluster-binding NifX family protein